MTAPTDNGEFPGSTPRPWEVGGPYPSTSVIALSAIGCNIPGYETPDEYELITYLDQRTTGEPDATARANAALIVAAVNNHDHLTAEVRRLTDEVAGLKEERDRLLSIKRLFTHDCNKIIELIEWSKKGNGNLDLEWAADQVGNALSNAHLIDIGAYRPGVFMPTGSEEATALTSP